MMWVFSSFKSDALFLLIPGHLYLLVLLGLDSLGVIQGFSFLALIAFVIIDNGHVYVTFSRLIKEKLHSDDLKKIIPFIIAYVLIIPSIQIFNMQLLWKFVLYATLWHYVKQSVGFLKLYQRLNVGSQKLHIYFLYFVETLALVGFHFRLDSKLDYYSGNDIFSYPDENLLRLCQITMILVTSLWGLWTFREYRKSKISIPSVAYILSNATLFSCILIPFIPVKYILISIIMTHGLPYLYMVALAVRTNSPAMSFGFSFIGVVVLAIIFGSLENFGESYFVDYTSLSFSWSRLVINTLLLFPLFTHFFFDSFFWKSAKYPVRTMLKMRNS